MSKLKRELRARRIKQAAPTDKWTQGEAEHAAQIEHDLIAPVEVLYKEYAPQPAPQTESPADGGIPCGCIEGHRPCAKACGLDMNGWICERETMGTAPTPQPSVASEIVRRIEQRLFPKSYAYSLEHAEARIMERISGLLALEKPAPQPAGDVLVSLDAVEKVIREEWIQRFKSSFAHEMRLILEQIRARLAAGNV
jgi:hypothetical protein